jgi:hypothetical protein
LAHASQAQHDPLHVRLISAKDGKTNWPGVKVSSAGKLIVPTQATDVGKTILLRYRAVDAAGRESPIKQVEILVTDDAPTALNQTFGPVTAGEPFAVPAPGLLAGALGPDLTVDSVSSSSFDTHADAFTYSSDGSFTVTPSKTTDTTAGSLTFTYTVKDLQGKDSAPATATILVAPTATTHTYNATPGQALTVSAGQGLLNGAVGPGLTLGTISAASFDATDNAFSANADGSFAITPPVAEDSATLTFDYTVVNGQGTPSAPQTVTIKVAHLAPVGVNDSFAVTRGTTLSGCVLTNDTFYGSPTSKSSTTPSHPAWSSTTWGFSFDTSTGCFTMSPSTRRSTGTLTFTYQPVDSVTGSTASASIVVS